MILKKDWRWMLDKNFKELKEEKKQGRSSTNIKQAGINIKSANQERAIIQQKSQFTNKT